MLISHLQNWKSLSDEWIPELEDMNGVEMMDWIEEHATIREEEYQVKVEFEDPRLWQTMTFKVTPSEKCSSLKVRVAKTIGHFASKLLLFHGSDQLGYSLFTQ